MWRSSQEAINIFSLGNLNINKALHYIFSKIIPKTSTFILMCNMYALLRCVGLFEKIILVTINGNNLKCEKVGITVVMAF